MADRPPREVRINEAAVIEAADMIASASGAVIDLHGSDKTALEVAAVLLVRQAVREYLRTGARDNDIKAAIVNAALVALGGVKRPTRNEIVKA